MSIDPNAGIATHLFEQAGALEQAAQLASSWFTNHLPLLQHTP